MNGRKLCQLALALAAVTATGAAIAGRGYYHGGGYHGGGYYHGGYYHGGYYHGFYPSVGVYFGPGWYGGYPYGYGYPYPYYYPPAVMAAPASPPQYIEQGPNGPVPAPGPEQAAPQTPDQAWWYHCNQPEGYYPYIHACPGGWQRVPAQPPSSSEAPESRMSS
ncbi:hypothetical protein K2O51_15180 [Cupriavidus pinatubonensis]|uniref:hypothetical protein n=1 Tax=Cupriavidus pinatubonensis TaxID=248026 RepID=UPI001C731CB7|nr:hypothetical protein [Cupriavidus pinatubonensis]QYY32140.1 hypothetical protein K2O51_15180 [Cupriavidus pinatubonensis]